MDDITKLILSATLSLVVALLVLFLGQLLVRFVFDPIQEYHKVRGEIAHAWIYYANVDGVIENSVSSKERCDDAADAFRKLAARLRVQTYAIPRYGMWAALHLLQPRHAVLSASADLIALSNSQHRPESSDNRHRARKQIAGTLRLIV